ncbi:MAG TPA: zinc ribbon domain-containing protein [Mobilitalea sp.]|nr:zinc ribbon domain-containing protein [Mobilitalea sp.]
MFFIFGISSGEKKFNFAQTIICSRCGQFGRLEMFMTFTYISLFFIPVFRWNRQYFVKSSCCNTVYSIDPELGKRLSRGEEVELTEQDLHMVRSGYRQETSDNNYCPHCGYRIEKDFEYCPKCGERL